MTNPTNQPRGQPTNRGQWRATSRANDPTLAPLSAKPMVSVHGVGPYRVAIRTGQDEQFRGILGEIKSIPGRRFDPDTKEWVIPGSASDALAQSLNRCMSKGWTVEGGPVASSAPNSAQPSAQRSPPASSPPTPMTTARIQGHGKSQRIEIALQYGQTKTREHLKEKLPTLRWDGDKKVWHLPPPRSAAGWERFSTVLNQVNIGTSPAIETVRDEGLADPSGAEHLADTPLALYDYQEDGAKFILKHRRVLIGDEPGLGKTIQSLAAVSADDAYPVVVVCPASLRSNWKREAQRMCPDASIRVLDTAPKGTPPATEDVIIVGYETLAARQEWLPPEPKAVIYDEMHYLQNPKAKRTKAADEFTQTIAKGGLLVGLSGTPMRNRPANLEPWLSMTGLMSRFGGKWRFLNRYCDPEEIWNGKKVVTSFTGSSNLGEMNDILTDGIMLRRRKAEVLKELPPKTTTLTSVDLGSAMRDLYVRCELAVAEATVESHLDSLAHLSSSEAEDSNGEDKEGSLDDSQDAADAAEQETLQARQEAAEALDELIRDGINEEVERRLAESTQKMARSPMSQVTFLRRLASVAKLPEVVNRIEDWLDSAEPSRKLVVFAHHRAAVRMLAERFNGGLIYGGISDAERQETIDRFTNGDEPRVLVCSIGAAGVGLNFQRASDVLFAEQPWSPADCIQAEDRCHRIGQTRGVMVEYVMAANTIDEMVAETIEQKRQIAGEAIDGEGNWDQEMTQAVMKWLDARRGQLHLSDAS